MTKPRQFTLKDGAPPVRLEPSREIRPYYVRGPRGHARPEVFGPGGVVFRDGGDEQEQAAREWLWHLARRAISLMHFFGIRITLSDDTMKLDASATRSSNLQKALTCKFP